MGEVAECLLALHELVSDYGPVNPPSDTAAELLQKLHDQAGNGVLFGHEDTTAYGVGWNGEEARSDIKDVCGKWPAVYGWDIGCVDSGEEEIAEGNIDGVPFEDMSRLIIEADARGGINTLSFHQENPNTRQSAFDNTPAVGELQVETDGDSKSYLEYLDSVATFLLRLHREDGSLVPVIFRPLHEHNMSWAWWGRESCSLDDYIALYQLFVRYLRNVKNCTNVLFAYAPQDVSTAEEYLQGYPGDEFVDVLGLDYYTVWDQTQMESLVEALTMLNGLAEEKGKVAALTETGIENVPIANWWTEYLLPVFKSNEVCARTVWVLIWRNSSEEHFFGPYPGQESAEDFVAFQEDGTVVFVDAE